jgi:hypothetical protein
METQYPEKWLCGNGHLHYNYFDSRYDPRVCFCGAKVVWKESINIKQPNTKLELEKEEIFEECRCCGHKELVEQRTYKIPERKSSD